MHQPHNQLLNADIVAQKMRGMRTAMAGISGSLTSRLDLFESWSYLY